MKRIKEYDLGKSNGKAILFLSENEYISKDIGDINLFFPKRHEVYILENLDKLTKLKKDTLIITLQDEFMTGVFVLLSQNEYNIFGPYLDTSVSYCEFESEILVSDSAFDIAYKKQFQVSPNALSVFLISGLPFEPFQNYSMWDEINKIKPCCILQILNGELHECKTNQTITKNKNIKDIANHLRNTLIVNFSKIKNKYSEISCDISGGVDSACIAYIINKISHKLTIFHAESDASANSDTEWAQYIAEDLRVKLNKLPSVDVNGKRFSIEDDYLYGNIPDLPLLWGDTEGYVSEMIDMIESKSKHVHMIGIGGDEIFTPMTSTPWSIIREEGMLKSITYILRYSILMRRPFISCILDLFNNIPLKKEINFSIENGFKAQKTPSKRELKWSDDVKFPVWITDSAKENAHNKINELFLSQFEELSDDRTHFQILQSLIFQKKVFSQIVQTAGDEIDWYAPFLDAKFIKSALTIPSKYSIDSQKTKPMLYETLKGIVPLEIFTRGVKGDYSSALYNGYRSASKKWIGKTHEFELAKLGIINPDILDCNLSMPSSNYEKVDDFMKVCNLERWLRQINKYIVSTGA